MTDQTWPAWVETLKGHYLSGGSSFFILHGAVDDVIGSEDSGEFILEGLSDYLARKLFGEYDLVLHYDLGRGLRPHPGSDPRRLAGMNSALDRILGRSVDLPRDPLQALTLLERLITYLLVGGAESGVRKTALLFDYAELICPPGDRYSAQLATFLNWARNPVIKRVNMVFILMTGSLSRLNSALVQSGHTTEIRLPMPSRADRKHFVRRAFPEMSSEAGRLAEMSSGLTLTNLNTMLRMLSKKRSGKKRVVVETEAVVQEESPLPPESPPDETAGLERIGSFPGLKEEMASSVKRPLQARAPDPGGESDAYLTGLKKALIESQAPGLIEFIEPDLDLSLVAGHAAAKERLTEDAGLIRAGRLEAVPMGYLICGPVGVGKTFIALCYAGTVGVPCVKLQNFRSKYVGETEANLEKVLGVLRELGPVAVIIDEADAAVGDRGASGDSGTSARVFAQLASQMGDTRYRGRVIWFMLTCRPDLLPVDLKRQGRCEEHIPLFYPETPEDRREMFQAMSAKLKIKLPAGALDGLEMREALSGADIEGLLTRARREAFLRNRPLDRDLLAGVIKTFHSPRSPEHELQWLAGILECSDLGYLPEGVRKAVETEAGFGALTRRFRELKAQLE